MVFFNHQTNDQGPSDHDYQCADRLHLAVLKRFKRRAKWSRKAWANQFRILRNEVEQDVNRVDTALNWYIEQLTGSGTSSLAVASAQGFRKNFTWIEERSKRSGCLVLNQANTELSPTIKQVTKGTGHLVWPTKVNNEVLTLIVNSIHEYQKLYDAFKKLYTSRKDHPKLKLDIEHLYHKLADVVSFVTQWVIDIHTMIQNWKSWSGSLKGLHFTIQGKRFTKIVTAWCTEYSGDGSTWSKLLELMGYG